MRSYWLYRHNIRYEIGKRQQALADVFGVSRKTVLTCLREHFPEALERSALARTSAYQRCRSCRTPLPTSAERLRVDCCSYGCHVLVHGELRRDTVPALLARLAALRKDAS